MLYAVIVAGGQGTRLWPASRKSNPKHLRPFVGGETLLQKTYMRIAKLIPAERIYVCTNVMYAEEFLSQIPELTSDRLILEPESKNNGPAVGMAAAVLQRIDPEAVMVNLWADHFYENEEGYLKMIARAAEAAEKYPDHLVGIQAIPNYPATGFGYLEAGEVMDSFDGHELYHCKRFVEKPDLETAKQYLAAGNYYWNAATFVWRVEAVLNQYKELAPEVYAGLMKIADAWGTTAWTKIAQEVYKGFPSIGFDYLISEKTSKICFMAEHLGWKDVGSWQIVHEVLAEIDGTDLVSRGKVITVEAENSLIFNENEGKLVAVVGVDDLVVVDTHDALLIMRKSQDQDVKKAIAKIVEMGEQQHL